MLTITDGGSLARALSSSLDPSIKRLLSRRCKQLGGDIKDQACFLVAQPGDTPEAIEAALDFPAFSQPELGFGCEWVADHGALYEAVWLLTDCGFAHVALVPKHEGIDPALLSLCRTYAEQGAETDRG